MPEQEDITIDIALILPPTEDERWDLARQMGVTQAVVHPLEIGDGELVTHEFDPLLAMYNRFRDAGIDLSVIEGSVPFTDTTRLGREGRDEEIERFKQFLRNLGSIGIPTVAYDWSAGLRWARTSTSVRSRGGSLTSEYDNAQMAAGPPPDAADTTHDQLWEALEHFLKEVVPVAEEAGVKLALHPDDPPRSEVRGMPRIATNIEAFHRVTDIVDSPANGITFCQGNFRLMTDDLPATIREFGDRINFVHFRDVEGDTDHFVETWHDNGPTDMLECIEAYSDIGFTGVARPDHVPTMAGEDNSNPGYHTLGRLFAVGYMRGLLE